MVVLKEGKSVLTSSNLNGVHFNSNTQIKITIVEGIKGKVRVKLSRCY